MIDRILVPLDGSVTAEVILPQVRRLLRRSDSEVILLRAANPPPVENYVTVFEAALQAAREYVFAIRDRLDGQGIRARAIAELGHPAQIILETADKEHATLIAMATHGRSGLPRLLLGSVAEQVLRKSPVPVLAIRPFWSYTIAGRPEDQAIRNVLVPVDGSPLSLEVMPHAVEFAKLFDARVVLLRVLEPATARTPRARAGRDLEQVAEKFSDAEVAMGNLQELAEKFRKEGVTVLTLVDEGDPVAGILGVCRFHDIDLVAMTTHGRSGISRLSAGSVTEKVLRNATVPILVVRASKAAVKAEKKSKAMARKG